MNVDAGFACSGGPIRSSQKHSREKNNEPIREHRCWLWMVQWAHSKRSETYSERNYWVHSGASIPPFPAPAGPFKAVGNIFKRKILGPSVNIDAGFAWFNGPIHSSRKHYWKKTTGPIQKHRYRLFMLLWAHSK
jgi:hypothetical protein